MSSPTETITLFGGRVKYEPIDGESEDVVRSRRRWKTKVAVAAVLAVAAIVAGAAYITNNRSQHATASAAVQVDSLFAGLLFDEKGFYFPMDVSSSSSSNSGTRRRYLRALTASDSSAPRTSVDWSYDWTGKDSKKDFAAIGEYYRGKGLSIADYYKSKYDPTYVKSGASSSSSSSSDAAPWTPDWQADKERGIAIGQKYAAIGETIADHYRQAFDPTYVPTDDNTRRSLKSKDKKKKERKEKKKRDMMVAYDWRADRDRGIAIGQKFKELGDEIAAHYMDDNLSSADWQKYRDHALEIAERYQQKAAAIQQFYDGDIEMEGMALPNEDAPSTLPKGNKDSHMWGLDYKQDRKHALAIHKAWMDKGIAIGDYYRSVYDPTYDLTSSDASDKKVQDGSDTQGLRNPDLDYPPWGQDPEADRAHGKALGEYWAQKGQAIGAYWEKKGPELHAYYEDKYRSMFDPTYAPSTSTTQP